MRFIFAVVLSLPVAAADFYAKRVDAGGIPVLSSSKTSDAALAEARSLIERMLSRRKDVRAAMVRAGTRFVVMAANEMTTDIPECANLRPKLFWDKRARGLGSCDGRPVVSCGEENLLAFEGDPYPTENVLIHEFAHAMHEIGLKETDFDARLKTAYEKALAAGLWKGVYAGRNRNEYWAEGSQSWFDANRRDDADHNHVDTREKLKAYDPALAALLAEIYGDGPWRYKRPQPGAGRFVWPKHVLEWYAGYEAAEKGASLPAGAGWVELDALAPEGLRSRDGEACEILFVNRTSVPLQLHWIDGEGKRTSYYTLRPGDSEWQQSYAGHVFLLTRPDGSPAAAFRASSGTGRAIVRP